MAAGIAVYKIAKFEHVYTTYLYLGIKYVRKVTIHPSFSWTVLVFSGLSQ